MIDLYTWSTPNGYKASIALEEMGLDYTTHPINIMKDEQFQPHFLKVSPNNKIPAIHDQDTGQSVFESGAILMYLANKTGTFLAPDGPRYWQAMEWLMWQMGGLGPMLGQVHFFSRNNKDKAPFAEERFQKEAARLYGVLDKRLGEAEYLAGDYSIADIAAWPWVSRYEWHMPEIGQYENVVRWYRAIAARPAVVKGYHVPVEQPGLPIP